MNLVFAFHKLLTILIAITGAGSVVFIHECGHFLFCKLFGIKTPTFSIGMGPSLFKFKIGSTNFQVSALPAGGYVEIECDENNRNAPGNFYSISYIKKMIILLGGVSFNLLGAFAVYTCVNYFVGMPDKIASITVASIEKNALVTDILQPGDILLGVNGKLFSNQEVTYETYLEKIRASKGHQLSLLVKRGLDQSSWIDINVPDSDKTQGILGAMLQPEMHKETTRQRSLLLSVTTAINTIKHQISFVTQGTYSLFKTKSLDGVAGPIMTLTRGFQIAEHDFVGFLLFLAFISLNLALMNILPLSLMDGGRVFTVTLEAIVGRPLTTLTNVLHVFSITILGGLFMFISFKEIRMLSKEVLLLLAAIICSFFFVINLKRIRALVG
jgi:regulator of sigma E protease